MSVVDQIQLLNFRTYLEFDANFKRFLAESINVFLTMYFVHLGLQYCFINQLSWLSTMFVLSLFAVLFYTQFIDSISLLPNFIMFLTSSIMFFRCEYLTNGCLIKLLIAMIYSLLFFPIFYLLLRRWTLERSHTIGLKLQSIRERIHRRCLPIFSGTFSPKTKLHQLYVAVSKLFLLLFLVLFL